MPKTLLTILTLVSFLVSLVVGPMPAYAQDYHLPAPGVMVHLSPEFNPPILKGIKVHPDNPFQFDFILDKGDSQLSNNALKDESSKLIKYFLASLTIPEKDLWVNLSPYEKDRIIPNSFGLTEMGRDLLAEDYMLKQITASLIYPEDEIGKKFWKRIYEEAAKKYGTTNIPVNTFNKVWIVPEKAVVYENAKAGTAYVVESKLKVMLEQDYWALSKNECRGGSCIRPITGPTQGRPLQNDVNALGSQIVREIVIPELTKEVNENKNFAKLRQVYNSLILATWYKKKIKDSILAQVYADKNKVAGVGYRNSLPLVGRVREGGDVEAIYQRYLQAFKKGVYNYIKEEQDPLTQETIPRKYFSGGFDLAMTTPRFGFKPVLSIIESLPAGVTDDGKAVEVEVNTVSANQNVVNTKTVNTVVNNTSAGDRIFGAMHTGDNSAGRLDALRRLLRMNGIDIEEWANEQAKKMKGRDIRNLKEVLISMGLNQEQIGAVLNKIILVNVPAQIRLEGGFSRIGGVIIRTKNGPMILFPKDRLAESMKNKEFLGDLFYEVVEIQAIERGVSVDDAHVLAMRGRDKFLGKHNALTKEFNEIFVKQINEEELFGSISPRNTEEILRSMKIKNVAWIDKGPFDSKVFQVISETGDNLIVFVDGANQVTSVAFSTADGNSFGVVQMKKHRLGERFSLIANKFNGVVNEKLRLFLEQKNFEDRRLEYRSGEDLKNKQGVYLPLVNHLYTTAQLRNDFVNNPIMRNILRLLDPTLIYRHSNTIFVFPVNVNGFSIGEETWYSLHTYSVMDSFPLSHESITSHELAHELFFILTEEQKKQLANYFLYQRPELDKVIVSNPAYAGLSRGNSLVSEVIAHIIGALTNGYTKIYGDRIKESIYKSDIEILIKFGFLPKEFGILASPSHEPIKLEDLVHVYPQAQNEVEKEARIMGGAKVVGAMHEVGDLNVAPEVQLDLSEIKDERKQAIFRAIMKDKDFVNESIKRIFPDVKDNVITKCIGRVHPSRGGGKEIFEAAVTFQNGEKRSLIFIVTREGLSGEAEHRAIQYREISEADPQRHFTCAFGAAKQLAGDVRDYVISQGYAGMSLDKVSVRLQELTEGTLDLDHMDETSLREKLEWLQKNGFFTLRGGPQILNIKDAINNRYLLKQELEGLLFYLDGRAVAFYIDFFKETGYFHADPNRGNIGVQVANNELVFKLMDYDDVLPVQPGNESEVFLAFNSIFAENEMMRQQAEMQRPWSIIPEDFLRLVRKVYNGSKFINQIKEAPNTPSWFLKNYIQEIEKPKEEGSRLVSKSPRDKYLRNFINNVKPEKGSGPGGIDLTPANMHLQTQNAGEGIKFHLDPAMLQQLQNAPGFVPVIIGIQPLNNLRKFLGIDASV